MSDTPPPLAPNAEALEFLLTRRSRPPRMLGDRAPDRAALTTMLEAASRVPDHGKLEPWRFVVLEAAACERLAELSQTRGEALGLEPARIAKDVEGFRMSPLIVAVIAAPKAHPKVPESEQLASAAAVCLSLLNAALASGWGAVWLTGWRATDRLFLTQGLRLFPHETVAGYIHIGNETRVPPDRPRPDIDALTTWIDT
ncbi:nitroreductase family protein [Gymnodinialimonas ceratoperidinii]|uniref:Putative NAD(P)H nitroreductase n=1 Tax=Gymnodinialimonas ceratoperidinii TaxID=2856823 RepID=A0A8F6TYS1_9RHOB|nr:nitroreductase [Gymnodinialimonas ceratoperidinii]QXT40933.1 nitroreductase [Gymnodinialimonas ceratoperidinii]